MCLESLNQLLGLPFAWLALGLLAVVVAALGALYLLASPKKDANNRQSSTFTCPCYAPPANHQENNKN